MSNIETARENLYSLIGRVQLTRQDRDILENDLQLLYTKAKALEEELDKAKQYGIERSLSED